MRWPIIVFTVGAVIALVGLYFGVGRQEWTLGSLLLVVGLSGVGAGILTRRPKSS